MNAVKCKTTANSRYRSTVIIVSLLQVFSNWHSGCYWHVFFLNHFTQDGVFPHGQCTQNIMGPPLEKDNVISQLQLGLFLV